jgi:hypothetical protein
LVAGEGLEPPELCKMTILQRNARDREPFNDGKYAVRAFQGQWAAFRIADNVRIGNLHARWEGARNDIYLIRRQRINPGLRCFSFG